MAKSKAKAKKAKGKTETKTTNTRTGATRGTAKKSSGKDVNPAEMRRRISKIVNEQLGKITQAAVGEAKKGQLATTKYLWEVTGVYPPVETGIDLDRPEEEDTFMQRLVRRFGVPEGPLPSDEDDDEDEDLPAKATLPMTKNVADVPVVAPEVHSDGEEGMTE
jgi:hypothetical protein